METQGIKEKRIRELTLIYYSRADVRKALFEFAKNRECIPRYFEGFGKRPDTFQYEGDILEQVKKGATSFHSSEEIWQDPLEISTELTQQEFNDLRIGWDLLLDIDSPYLEYSKIYADLIIKTLKFHGIKNIGVKFSGSKGLHIIIPWKAFPQEIYGQKTKGMFPDWPRAICEYLTEITQKKLADKILKDIELKEIAERLGKTEQELVVNECKICKRPAIKKQLITWICPNCKSELTKIKINKRIPKCPNDDCRKELEQKTKQDIYYCEFCEINSDKNPEQFEKKERFATEKLIEADLILVAPRHLFRMPYSLHEKTALSSIVLDPDKILDFQIQDAKPFKIQVQKFYPEAEPGEAKNLLLQALDWKEQKQKQETENKLQEIQQQPTQSKQSKQHTKITIPNPDENLFPPCIKLILKGVKQDGRKRALFILMNFFKSLGVLDNEIQKRITQWNEKNYKPLKQGYIQSQFIWYKRNTPRLPPNCDKHYYKDLAICKPDELCRQIKNPLSYAIKKHFRKK